MLPSESSSAVTPTSSSKFAHILLELKRDDSNDYGVSTIATMGDMGDRISTYDRQQYNEDAPPNPLSAGGHFLGSSNNFCFSNTNFTALSGEYARKGSDHENDENDYQDSSIFTALNRIESTEMCNCKKSRCLKLYCQCFAAKFICTSSCRCVACENVSKSSKLRKEAVQSMLERNPAAFDSKYKPSLPNPTALGPVTAHKIGCKCRRSRCLKKYCECFEGAVPCSSICSCVDCCNPANPQLGRGTKPTAAAVKYNTDNVSQFEQFKSISHQKKEVLSVGSQDTDYSTDDEIPSQMKSAVAVMSARPSSSKALCPSSRSASWSVGPASSTSSASLSHQLKRKRSVDSAVNLKQEYKELDRDRLHVNEHVRHSSSASSRLGPPRSSFSDSSSSESPPQSQSLPQPSQQAAPNHNQSDGTPNGLNIVSALALLSSSIASEKGISWGGLTSLQAAGSENQSNGTHSHSALSSATPNSLGIATVLALLSQSIQAEQGLAASSLDSPPNQAFSFSSSSNSSSSSAPFLSPNTLSIASALALLSSSIEQQQQKSRQSSVAASLQEFNQSTCSSEVHPSARSEGDLEESISPKPTLEGFSASFSSAKQLCDSSVADGGTSHPSPNHPSPSESNTDKENGDSPNTVVLSDVSMTTSKASRETDRRVSSDSDALIFEPFRSLER